MPPAIGSRDIGNLRWGPATIYIGDGGTIAAASAFGESTDQSSLTTLLTSFTKLGEMRVQPEITTASIASEVIQAVDIFTQQHHLISLRAEFDLVEVDNTIVNELISLQEARTPVDFLFVRTQVIGDYIHYLRNVPFLLDIDYPFSFKKLQSIKLRVAARAQQHHLLFGQKEITGIS